MRLRGRAAVFLDRDGTVVEDTHYLADPERVTLIPGAAAAIRRMSAAGLPVMLVMNQSGIAHGLYTEEQYRAVARRVDELIQAAEARVDATYYCPHHPEYGGPCDCRKPATGLYRLAAREHGLEPADSYFVGDKLTDVLPLTPSAGRGFWCGPGTARAPSRASPRGSGRPTTSPGRPS